MPQPVSFFRLAAPILVVWAAWCATVVYALGYLDTDPTVVVHLFPVYAGLYLIRAAILLVRQPLPAKAAAAGVFVLMWVPVAFAVPHLIMALGFVLLYAVVTPLALVAVLVDLPTEETLVLLPVLAIGGGICGAALALLERIIAGASTVRAHIFGLMAAGLPAALLPGLGPTGLSGDEVATALLAVLPVPHLVAVWRARRGRGGPEAPPFTPRRALVFAAGVYAAFYTVGIARFLSDRGAAALLWPAVVYSEEAARALDGERHAVLGTPQGRGALPIGGRWYMVPADMMDGLYQYWNDAPGEYVSLSVRVPYASWIDGFSPGGLTPIADAARLERAELDFSAVLSGPQNEATVRCASERIYGLRQCFADADEEGWLDAWGIDPADLELVHLRGWQGPAGRYQVLVLDDHRQAPADGFGDGRVGTIVAAGGDTGFLARCPVRAEDHTDAGGVPPLAAWRHSDCTLQLTVGDALVHATINVQLLRYWRQIRNGLRADLADWQAAAEGAEPIDAVARRIAEQRADVPLSRYVVRLMTAPLEW